MKRARAEPQPAAGIAAAYPGGFGDVPTQDVDWASLIVPFG